MPSSRTSKSREQPGAAGLRARAILCWFACAAGGTTLLPVEVAAQQDLHHDSQFVEGLRERRQFTLAAEFCERKLTDQGLPISLQTQFAVELVRIHTEQAIHAPRESRGRHWQQAGDAANGFLEVHRGAPRAIFVEIQAALAVLARGELARIESELGSDAESRLNSARDHLRAAIRQLEQIEVRLGERAVGRPQSNDSEIDAGELRGAQHHVQQQLARALRNQALCFPAGSTDRIATLTAALRHLETPLSARAVDDPLGAELLLEQATCQRLLGNLSASQAALGVLSQSTSPRMQLRRRAEQIRLQLAAGDTEKVLSTIAAGREFGKQTSAELDSAMLEAFVTLWRQNSGQGNENPSQNWQQRAIAAAEFIGRNHGPYWARRADLALVAAGQQAGSGSVAILSRTAADLSIKGQLSEAGVVYEKAAAAARQTGDSAAEFEMAYRAALVQQELKQHQLASDRFRRLAIDLRDDSRAAEAHLVAITNAAEAVRSQQATLGEYQALLEEHLTQWPTAPTTSTVASWQGRLREQQQDWAGAVSAYRRQIDSGLDKRPEDPALVEALAALARIWLVQIWDMAAGEQQAAASDALAYFDRLVFENVATGGLPEVWTAFVVEAAYQAARYRLLLRPREAAIARRLLDAADAHASLTSEERRQAVGLWKRLAHGFGQGGPQLSALLDEIPVSTPDGAAILFAALASIARSTQTEARRGARELLELQRALGERLCAVDSLLAAARRRDANRWYAAALVRIDRAAGLAEWTRLAGQYRDDREIQLEFARHLSDPDSRGPTLQQALDQWRRVASQSPPRGQNWFEAKYQIAELLFRLGKKEDAAQRIRYLQVTEDLPSHGYADRFARLLQRCEG